MKFEVRRPQVQQQWLTRFTEKSLDLNWTDFFKIKQLITVTNCNHLCIFVSQLSKFTLDKKFAPKSLFKMFLKLLIPQILHKLLR